MIFFIVFVLVGGAFSSAQADELRRSYSLHVKEGWHREGPSQPEKDCLGEVPKIAEEDGADFRKQPSAPWVLYDVEKNTDGSYQVFEVGYSAHRFVASGLSAKALIEMFALQCLEKVVYLSEDNTLPGIGRSN